MLKLINETLHNENKETMLLYGTVHNIWGKEGTKMFNVWKMERKAKILNRA